MELDDRRRIRQNFVRLFNREVVNRGARFGASIVLARALTVSDYGVVNVGIAAAGILLTATTLGLHDLGAREVAVRPEGARALLKRVLAARLLALGSVAACGLIAIAVVAPDALPIAGLTVALALMTTLSPEWILRGQERMREFGYALALGGLAVLAGAVLVSLLSGSAEAGLATFVAGEAVTMLASWLWVRGHASPGLSTDDLLPLVTGGWPIAVSSLAVYAYFANADTLILAAVRSLHDAGLFSAAYRVFLVLTIPSIFASFALLPAVTRRFEADDAGGAKGLLRWGVPYLLAYGIMILALAQLAGGPLLGGLFGAEFKEMGDTFNLLCISVMWYSVGIPIGYALIGRERNKQFMSGAVTAAVLNLGLNAVLIPVAGAPGAAIATTVAFIAACLVWLRAQEMLDRELAPNLALMTALSLVAAAGLAADLPLEPFGVVTLMAGLLVLLRAGGPSLEPREAS